MGTDDGQLIDRALKGDERAFTEIVRRHRDMVYGYCYHRTGSFEDARDLAQDTFVRAYTSLGQLRDPEKLAAWLRRIAANLCTRWHERRRETVDEIPDQPGPAHQSAASECVSEALTNLPEKERLAVVLHYVNGYSYGDIAGFLEVTKAAVRGRLHRGRELLRAEVLKMTRDAFDENRLDEKFVVEAVRKAGGEAQDAYNLHADKESSRKKTDEAAALVDTVRDEDVIDIPAFAQALLDVGRREFILDETERAHAHWDRANALLDGVGEQGGAQQLRELLAYEQLRDGDLRVAHELYAELARCRSHERFEQARVAASTVRALEAIGLDTDGRDVVCLLVGSCWFKHEDGQFLHWGGVSSGYNREGYSVDVGTIGAPPLGPTPLPFVLISETPEIGDRLEFKADLAWQTTTPSEGSSTEVSILESLSDSVTTTAGEFHNCARVSTCISREGEELAKRTIWLVPGIGVVKIAVDAVGWGLNTCELVAYHIAQPSDAHVPLAVGNWWRHRWVEGEEQRGFRTEQYTEIVGEEDSRFLTIEYFYCVKL